MAWVETRITRTSQPQDAAQLDRAGKFYSRLIAVLDPISRRDLVTDKPLTIVGSFPRTAGKYGRSAQGDAASLGYIAVSGLGAEISMLGVMNNATCGTAGSIEFGLGSSAGTALACYQATNNTSNRFLLRQTNGGGTSTVSFATNAYTTGPYVVGASIVGSLASQIVTYFNGRQDRGVVLDGSGGSNSVFNRFSIGGISRSTNAGAQVGDDCVLAVLIRGALSESEFESLSNNPWQIFEPEELTIWVPDAVVAGGDDGVSVNLSVTDAADSLASAAAVLLLADLSVTDTTDSLSSSALVTVVADVSVTDAADTLASAASALVLADLSVTDTADALSSDASILADGGVICALDVTDEPDILTADCTITWAAVVDEVVSLGGPDKFRKFDVPLHRVKVDHSVTDEDDRLYAEAKVAQLMTRIAGLSVVDADDLVAASAGIYWDQPVLVRSSLSLVKSFDLQSILAAQHMDNDQLLASLKGIARYLQAS